LLSPRSDRGAVVGSSRFPDARFLVHEERLQVVADAVVAFLTA
jgi:hypothetical protein